MEIFGHILPNDAILGVGPLTETQIGFQKSLSFPVHLPAHTIVIKSELFDYVSMNATDVREQMRQWRKEYKRIRNEISVLINQPTDSVRMHNQEVENVAKEAMDLLEVSPHDPVNFWLTNDDIKTIHMEKIINRLKELATI